MSLRALALSATVVLAACAAPPPAADAPAAHMPASACNADAAQSLVGQAATQDNFEAARKASGAATLRMLKPGQPMTMDFRGDRVNVLEDANGKIEKITCG